MRPNLMIIENGSAILVCVGKYGIERELTTTTLHTGRYIWVEDCEHSQLCVGGGRVGPTIVFTSETQLARECNARLFKTRKGFDRAVAKARALGDA